MQSILSSSSTITFWLGFHEDTKILNTIKNIINIGKINVN